MTKSMRPERVDDDVQNTITIAGESVASEELVKHTRSEISQLTAEVGRKGGPKKRQEPHG